MKIYFPALNAEASAPGVTRGGSADVFDGFSKGDGAYIGKRTRERFTTKKPANWEPEAYLHHIKIGGFCYNMYQ